METNSTKLNLKNKVVFISGLGKGLGFAILKKLVNEGAYVYAITRSKYFNGEIINIDCGWTNT